MTQPQRLQRSPLPQRERVADIARVRRVVANAVDSRDVLRRDESVVVAVSGGPDSTALLDVLVRLAPTRGWRLYAVHVDHGLRPDSAAEADVVGALSARYGIPFESVKAAIPLRGSPQDRYRRARYAALAEVADRVGAGAIALGHTADDQAETVLMRVLSGAAPHLLMGMRERDRRLARPLLGVWRDQTHAYCAALGITPIDDPSNTDSRYLRTHVRHDLLPAIEAVFPAARRRLLALAAQQRRNTY